MTLLEKLEIDLSTPEGLAKIIGMGCVDLPCHKGCSYSRLAEDRKLCKAKHLFDKAPEPEIDWTKVPKDTKVLVSTSPDDMMHKRYFSHFKDGAFMCFNLGDTSWSADCVTGWRYCELAEEPKEEWLK